MKRKLIAGLCISMLTLSLVGCSSSDDKAEDKGNDTNQEQAAGFTGEKTVETKADPEKEDVIVTTINFEDGKPVAVNIDMKDGEGVIKSELSAKGEYVMKEGEEKAWHEQVDLLEEAIVANDFDLSKITLTNDAGNTDAVSGVSIKVGAFLTSVEECLAEAQK